MLDTFSKLSVTEILQRFFVSFSCAICLYNMGVQTKETEICFNVIYIEYLDCLQSKKLVKLVNVIILKNTSYKYMYNN